VFSFGDPRRYLSRDRTRSRNATTRQSQTGFTPHFKRRELRGGATRRRAGPAPLRARRPDWGADPTVSCVPSPNGHHGATAESLTEATRPRARIGREVDRGCDPARQQHNHGSPSSWSANTYITAAMCLHGFSQSGQLQRASSVDHDAGNRSTARRETRLRDRVGPHRRGDAPQTRLVRQARRRHSPTARPSADSAATVTTYGVERDPCT